MDYKFLNKVVNQIVSETRIDYDMEEIQFPFPPLLLPSSLFSSFLLHSPSLFSNHCKTVYGLNEEETEYVWKEYREIIKDKIKNNG
jgi:hypothetical protein